VQALLTVLVVASVVIIAFSRMYLGLHWLSDVVGGALLAGVAVLLGTVALTTRCHDTPMAAPRTLADGFRPTPLRKGTHDQPG
jgi:membrane-associated phospholipid phosphatase